jgi:diadenosine tetraphosphate (Ap4A) HIT family hydrolase
MENQRSDGPEVLKSGCPFCEIAETKEVHLASSPTAFAFYDKYPSNPGHALVVPRVHVGDLYDVDDSGLASIWELVSETRTLLSARHSPDGFNIGVNTTEAAGQTVGHAHIHLIPRYRGDTEDPRGGIRWVLPSTAKYWE